MNDTVIPAIYDITPLGNNSLFFVKQNDQKGVVDKDNKTIIDTNGRKLIPFSNHHYIPMDEPFSGEEVRSACRERECTAFWI